MLATLVASMALAAAPPAAGPPAATGQVNVLPIAYQLPRFIDLPTAAAFASAYPHAAASMGMGGRALMHCQVAPGGRPETCSIDSEAPSAAGFGAAALNLARSYRLDPNDQATLNGSADLPINFAMSINEDDLTVAGPLLAAPTFADVEAAYPDIGGGVTGEAVMRCSLQRDGSLRSCRIIYLQPLDRDFDVAAAKLVHLFRMRIDPEQLKNHEPMVANVLMRMASPFRDEAKDRRISDPVWLEAPDPARVAALFPAQAAAGGVTTGTGFADCTVAVDGALTDCQPFAGDPPDMGFSEAAVKAVSVMRMSPWTGVGGPVDGARVRVPVRFTRLPVRQAAAH